MTNKNIIELNGQRYDTVSGKIVTESEAAATTVAVKVASAKTVHSRMQPSNKVRTMDVFGKVKKPVAKQVAAPTAQAVQAKPPKPAVSRAQPATATQHHRKVSVTVASRSHTKPSAITVRKASKPAHSVATHTTPHTRESSQTLMRRAVAKPGPGFKKSLHVQGSLQAATPSLIVKKTSAYKVTAERALRAQAIPQSKQVSRFETKPAPSITVAPVPVRPEPAETHKPIAASTVAPAPTNRSTDMFERAIENASHYVDTKAHAKAFRRKRHQQVLSIAAASLALLVIAGFATYLNTPGLQFKVASVKAGVTTAMPNFAATGFAYGGVRSDSGKLTIGLNDSSGSAQLVQQTTNWSEADLIRQANTGTDASGKPLYNTFRAGSVSVYRFSDTSATWIKNGVWYQLSSPTNLTDDQVKVLAQNS